MSTSERVISWRIRTKAKIVEMMGGECMRCGWKEHQTGLTFHHVNPAKKEFGIGSSKTTRSFDRIFTEVKKCILLCSNCHAVIHATNEAIWFNESIIPDYIKPATIVRKKSLCIDCNIPISVTALRCSSCAGKMSFKTQWPEPQTLYKMVKSTSYREVGRQLGVSDNAVKKHLKKYYLASGVGLEPTTFTLTE